MHFHQDSIKSLISMKDDKYFASAGLDKIIKIWDIVSGKVFKTFTRCT